MQVVSFPCETLAVEKRCSLLPSNVKAYNLLGAKVVIQTGLGNHINIDDKAQIINIKYV